MHDHSGKGYFNYRLINKFDFTMADSSIRGMGKGFGNLRTEFIINKKYYPKLLDLIIKYEDELTMYQNPYTLITAKYSVSDNYATQAKKLNYNPNSFDKKISKIKGLKRDNFDPNYLIKKNVLNKKNIIITGNTSGIGLELNKILIRKNKIIGISKSNSIIQNKLQLKVNLNNLNNLQKKILKIKIPNKIDYLILNAGILGKIDKIKDISVNEFLKILKINFLSNKVIIDSLLKKIKIKNVIAISSGAAKAGKDGWALYCTSKAAFYQLINIYDLEYKNIKFINLAPGLAKTRMQEEIYMVKKKYINSVKKFQKLYKMNKISSPEIIAKKIVDFLNKIKHFKSGSFIDLRNFN